MTKYCPKCRRGFYSPFAEQCFVDLGTKLIPEEEFEKLGLKEKTAEEILAEQNLTWKTNN